MNLSLKELNELIYCVGTTMSSKTNTYGAEDRTALYEKLTTELESRVNDIESSIVELERAPKQSTITEMPRYVKCIGNYGKAEIGTIYDTSDKEIEDELFGLTWEQVLFEFGNLKGVIDEKDDPRFVSVTVNE